MALATPAADGGVIAAVVVDYVSLLLLLVQGGRHGTPGSE